MDDDVRHLCIESKLDKGQVEPQDQLWNVVSERVQDKDHTVSGGVKNAEKHYMPFDFPRVSTALISVIKHSPPCVT